LNEPVDELLIYPDEEFRVIAPATEKAPLLVTLQLEPMDNCPAIVNVPVDVLAIEAEDEFIVTFPLAAVVPELVNVHDDPTVRVAKLTLLADPIVN